MSKKTKKAMSMLLVVALIAVIAIGGMLAYLTSEDSDVNVMTLGEVDIVQHEHDADGNEVADGKFGDLYPSTEVVKKVTVENTGKSDCYFRTLIAFEDINSETFDINFPISEKYKWSWDAPEATIVIDGVTYQVYEAVYKSVLPAGATSPESLTRVELSKDSTNADMEALGGTYEILVLSQAVQTAGFADAQVALDTAFGKTADNAEEWFKKVLADAAPKGDDDSVTYAIPEGTEYTTVSTSAELKTALNNKAAVILLKNGEYNWSGTGHIGTSQTVSIYGESKDAVLYHTFEGEANTDYDFDGYTVNFYGLTISGEKNGASYPGWARMSATYNDCVFKQTYGLYAGTHEFNYCTLNVTGDQYNIWTWGAENAKFSNCTFNSDGKAVLLYGQANTVLTVNDCVFNDKGGLEDKKAAIEIGNDYGKSYKLIVNNTTVNGYEINDKGINTGTTLWGNKNSMGTDKLNVVVDGVDVY